MTARNEFEVKKTSLRTRTSSENEFEIEMKKKTSFHGKKQVFLENQLSEIETPPEFVSMYSYLLARFARSLRSLRSHTASLG